MIYKASLTGKKFHKSNAFVRLVIGPIGSGKSVMNCMELYRKANLQKVHNGRRKSRWVVIRNTYRELVDTTIKTWTDWFPKNMGVWRQQDMMHTIVHGREDGSILDMEVLFRALDKPDDVKKLLSLELTGGFINEAKEIPKQVLDMLIGRVGRYPAMRDGGCSWSGIIMDTNPPDEDHWIYKMFEEERPDGWEVFHQPGGLDELAENRDNLPSDYYERMIPGKDPEWIKVFVHGQYGFVSDGKPVYPNFKDRLHVSENIIEFDKNYPLWVGLDFGRTPAAVFLQDIRGQWRAIDEITTTDMGAMEFGTILSKRLNSIYKDAPEVFIYGDPAGDSRSQSDDNTPYIMLASQNIDAVAAYTNDPVVRREAINTNLTRLTMTGEPGFIVSPACKMLRKGMNGGFKYRRKQVTGSEVYADVPDKNEYSHPCEACEYALVGAGEGYGAVNDGWNKPLKYDNRAIV